MKSLEKHTYINNANGAFVEDLYLQYKNDPSSVEPRWASFFEGYEFQNDLGNKKNIYVSDKEVSVVKLINSYRARGHLLANTNPIRKRRIHKADLELDYFNLSDADLDTKFEAGKEIGLGQTTLKDILAHLRKIYCHNLGVEFQYCRNEILRQWMYHKMEPIANQPNYSKEKKIHILEMIDKSVTFESFLQTKYVGKKRFSLEGIESLIPSMDAMIETGADLGVKEFVIGMAHRGRLNVLVNIFQKSYEAVFSEFEDALLPSNINGDGDVKYHKGISADIVTQNDHEIHLSLVHNPSHLEAVDPVVEGIVRAKKDESYASHAKIVPVLIHGDAAVAGQGVVYETIQLSKMHGYQTGGTIHIVINNQVGFTANYLETRSSVYCTAIAKVIEAPIFHVNGDDPETVVHAMQMAIEIRQKFNIDVFIDIVGYRRYGHNEGDEPRFTQPILYDAISKHPIIRTVFLNKLIEDKVITKEEADNRTQEFKSRLQEKLDFTRKQKKSQLKVDFLQKNWTGIRVAKKSDFESSISTGVSKNKLDIIAKVLVKTPDNFNLYSKMKKLLDNRKEMYFNKAMVDWGLAELLAYGTLLNEGRWVRLSGQDSQRGTFAHRHSVIKDIVTEEEYMPLNNISPKQAPFRCFNSILSEYAALGFEYGYSIARPRTLVIWEAQFGDFANGAQIIIDQFIATSESKWHRFSGIVLMLPHGYEGQGPEHSSARMERFLQLCGENNMFVANVTTPANLFHILRRQLHLPFRKPLILFTPKSLLRHPKVISPIEDLQGKNCFQEIIEDKVKSSSIIKHLVLCTGKIYYEASAAIEKKNRKDILLVRLEQIYPLAKKQLGDIEKKYSHAKWVWLQEEPENMGAWSYILRNLPHLKFKLISRKESASTATGNHSIHPKNQQKLMQQLVDL